MRIYKQKAIIFFTSVLKTRFRENFSPVAMRKTIVSLSFLILLAAVALIGEARAETSFVINLDGAQAGTSATATGFGALVVNESQGTAVLRMRVTPLSSAMDLNNSIQIRDENNQFLGNVSMINQLVSQLNDYAISSQMLNQLKQGKIRIVVSSANFPNGEIAGTIRPYSHFAGRISGSLLSSGGGGESTGGAFTVTGMSGQATAGKQTNGSVFNQHAGFWATIMSPTAAEVSVSGRVVTREGQGVRNVLVTLTDASGSLRTIPTATFGVFRFTNITVGGTYIISVSAKKYTFEMPSQVVSVQDEVSEIIFTTLE